MGKYTVKAAKNGVQFYVMEKVQNEDKISKVFYSEERCEEFILIANIADNTAAQAL